MRILKAFILAGIMFPALIRTAQAEITDEVFNKVIAVVNREVITQQDVNQLLSVLYAQYVHSYSQDKLLDEMEDMKKDILKRMVEDKLILSRAKELEIKVSEAELTEKLDQVKSGFESEEGFFDLLETQGITVSDLKDRYRDQIMMKKVVDLEIKSKINILPSDVSEYYEKNREKFRKDEKYEIRHILIKAGDNVSFELIRLEAQEIYDDLISGADFAETAREYSEGPNSEKGGYMGFVKKGEMLKELDEALSELSIGKISRPIKSEVGYHILKLEDMSHEGYYSLEEVTLPVRRLLFQKKFKERIEEWISKLRADAYIDIK